MTVIHGVRTPAKFTFENFCVAMKVLLQVESSQMEIMS